MADNRVAQRDAVVVASTNQVPANLHPRRTARDLKPAEAEQRGEFALGEDAVVLDPHVLALKEHRRFQPECPLLARRHAHLAARQGDELSAHHGN